MVINVQLLVIDCTLEGNSAGGNVVPLMALILNWKSIEVTLKEMHY